MIHIGDRVEYIGECRASDPPIKFVGEAFEIDIGRIHLRVERAAGLRVDPAGGDGDRMYTGFARGDRAVDGVLGKNRRVVIGKGD